ncbi:hypothetical protein QY890_05840 [Latilactobacillus sakei]
MTYSEQWDLETIFKGGLASPDLRKSTPSIGATDSGCFKNDK